MCCNQERGNGGVLSGVKRALYVLHKGDESPLPGIILISCLLVYGSSLSTAGARCKYVKEAVGW